ncbi:unnamed protein product [Allacma fusca]|uniref:IkappaB kinase n=1 Tax=Allacma fusca TaxID=39272 RepID=A0A8J2NUP0_9HEXA|nr:unnamed protein product [Allacma fusca]
MLPVSGTLGDWVCRHTWRGGHGEVALWNNQRTEQFIAVKSFLVHAEGQNATYHEKKFVEEIDFMKKANHPHIVSTVEPPPEFSTSLAGAAIQYLTSYFQPSPTTHYLFMEFCDGGTLRSLLRKPENVNGLSEKDVRAVLSDISDAITYLHGNEIIHRDIKPDNILIKLNPVSGRNIYKLGDLGLAKNISDRSMGKSVVGTWAYLAPEIQALYFGDSSEDTQKEYGKSADYWSFGVICFEICCGTFPFLPEIPDDRGFARYVAVKNKPDEVIAITKGTDSNIFHEKFPLETRLTRLFQDCITVWLPALLRWKHDHRGQYQTKNHRDALGRLRVILQVPCLEIYSVSSRYHYIVNDHKKIIDINEQIMIDSGIPVEQQLLFTRDGIQLESDDFALDFVKICPLYLLEKSKSGIISPEVKLSPPLSTFILHNSGASELFSESLIWKTAIHDVQVLLEISDRLDRYNDALRKTVVRAPQTTATNVSNRLFHLNKLLEQEERLDVGQLIPDKIDSLNSIIQARDAVKRDIRLHPANCDTNLTLQCSSLPELQQLYSVVLEEFCKWKNARNSNSYDMTALAELIGKVCLVQLSVLRTNIANNEILRKHLFPQQDDWRCQKQQSQLKELERLIQMLESRQLLKEKKLQELCHFK